MNSKKTSLVWNFQNSEQICSEEAIFNHFWPQKLVLVIILTLKFPIIGGLHQHSTHRCSTGIIY